MCQLTRMVPIRTLVVWAVLQAHLYIKVGGQAPERRYACWGSFGPPVVSAQCPRNTVIQVIRAGLKVQNHGGLCAYNDNDCGCEYGQKGCQMQDVRQLCMGRPACRLDVTQQYINTPTCKGFSDYMYIEFNCVPVEHNSVSDICSAVQTKSEHGFLRSPNYPGVSRAMRECDCTLTTDANSSIELTVLDIQTRDYECDHDKLLVAYDGRTDTYCGEKSEKATKRIASKSSVVSVKFDTDGKGVGGSFWLKYEAQPKAEVKLMCSYKETETTTLETSPATIEKATSTLKTTEKYRPSPKFYKPKKPDPKDIPEIKKKKPQIKPTPWWWRVMKNANKTKPTRKAIKPTTPPVLVDSAKTLGKPMRRQQGTIPESSTTSATITSTDHRYHHQHQQHPKLIQANKGLFPSKSESLRNPKDNMITIIAACVVASILMVIVLGIVIRFVVNRKQDRNRPPPLPKSKRYKQQTIPDNPYPVQKIPRPKRI